MKTTFIISLMAAVALLAGCTTRSISDSGYEAGRGNSYGSYGGGGITRQSELS